MKQTLLYPRGETMKDELYVKEQCSENPKLTDFFIIDKDGIKRLTFCSNTQEWFDFE